MGGEGRGEEWVWEGKGVVRSGCGRGGRGEVWVWEGRTR